MNSKIYKQADSRWGSKPYPIKKSSFAGNGCGCCACTHLVIEQEKYKDYTPEPLRKWMVSQGYAVAGQGTRWSGIPATLQHYGYGKVVHIDRNDPMTKAWPELNKGNRMGVILFLGGRAPNGTVWCLGGHYVAFVDYKYEGGLHKFYCKDSGGRGHDGWYSYEKSMKGLIDQVWIVERINAPAPAPSPTPAPTPSGKLEEDGVFGIQSVKAAQKLFGVSQTGKISGQLSKLKQYHKGFNGNVTYGTSGSALVKAIQKYLKMKDPDGQLGPNTIKAIQKMCGLSNPDGIWGPNTSRGFQKWLNNHSKL